MELVCLDFWSAEDNKQHSVDMLALTDYTKLAMHSPAQTKQLNKLPKGYEIMYFVFMGSLNVSILIRGPILKLSSSQNC